MKRFIIVVLDGFGIGAMEDAKSVRPGDERSNTLRSILSRLPDLKLPNLEKMGLMNAYGAESSRMKLSPEANFGKSQLLHYGADTFMGHQEIMGTLPGKPDIHPFQERVDEVAGHLVRHGHKVEIMESEGLRYVLCDDFVTVADNLETDPGMCYNVTAPLDFISFDREYEIGRLVREVVEVGRVIVFGGTGTSLQDLRDAQETKNNAFIGIASAKSKSYDKGYQCLHLGYGVDKDKQAPTILTNAGIPVTLIGKVADIVANDGGKSIPCVSSARCMKHTLSELKDMETGLICTNIQETDLAGHSQSTALYGQILETADQGIGEVLSLLTEEDMLLIMADHGNDPEIGHSRHTREYVPLLVHRKGVTGRRLGIRKTLSDVGASVCDYFGVKATQNGNTFMECLGIWAK